MSTFQIKSQTVTLVDPNAGDDTPPLVLNFHGTNRDDYSEVCLDIPTPEGTHHVVFNRGGLVVSNTFEPASDDPDAPPAPKTDAEGRIISADNPYTYEPNALHADPLPVNRGTIQPPVQGVDFAETRKAAEQEAADAAEQRRKDRADYEAMSPQERAEADREKELARTEKTAAQRDAFRRRIAEQDDRRMAATGTITDPTLPEADESIYDQQERIDAKNTAAKIGNAGASGSTW